MICNVSTSDRWIRLFIGGLLVAWAAAGGPVWAWAGVILLVTGAWRICPVYGLLGTGTYSAPPAPLSPATGQISDPGSVSQPGTSLPSSTSSSTPQNTN